MREYRYRKIDAFTSENSLGNPAACIYLEEGQSLSEVEMLDIAKRHKGFVSEVVYCAAKPRSEFGLTYYSSECEVDFCGHGTIACMYALITETPALLAQREITVRADKKGDLTVYNEIAERDAVYITAPEPRYIGTALGIEAIAENLSVSANQISSVHPVEVIDAGLRTLIVPFTAREDAIRFYPHEQKLKDFCLAHEIDIILVYSLETSKNIAHTRVFAPKFGYLEDPATGSGNSALGYYLLKNRLWDGKPVTVGQGGIDRVPNMIHLSLKDGRVLFGGKAATRIRGVYIV